MASLGFIKSLKKDQILRAEIEELHSHTELLCNFQGELLLVNNSTGLQFKKGSPISLQVVSVHPLKFQIFDPRHARFQRVI